MTDHVAHENRKQNQARERLGVKLGSNASYVKGPQAKNDDVKAAVERIMAAQYNEHSDVMVLIRHIDGEPARLAAAREEQREEDVGRKAMTDDVKKVVAWLRRTAGGVPHLETLLAHIDGEPARLAAAREEQREACVRHIREEFLADLDIDADSACLDAPLTATPLADELERSWQETARMVERAEKAEAERDALRAQVEKMKAEADPVHINDASFAVHAALGWGFDPNTVSPVSLARAAEALSTECMGLRAQVEAARKWAAHDSHGRGLLEVMDGAKP